MNNEGVLVVGELSEGKLAPITLELLGIGRKLADKLGQGLSVLFIGSGMAGSGQEAIKSGANKVYLADNADLAAFNSEAYTDTVTRLCRNLLPSILILGQTDAGIDIAPRIAGKLDCGLSMDCVELDIDPETKLLLQTRPVFGGNAYATMRATNARLQMATVRAYAMAPAQRDDSRQGEIIPLETPVTPSSIKVVQVVKQEAEGVKLEDARVIVAGGHGLGSAENFKKVEELAKVIGGAVGATRPVCEEGWVPTTHLVGQTGKIVRPDLYLAIGVSGAMQHLAGFSGSRYIVAINNDPQANIFKAAHYGVVADCNELVPELIKKLKEA